MTPLTFADPQTRSADLVAENVARLREHFPEAVTEGQIDFDVLRQLLGGAVDEREEKYGLNWHGKRRARQLALTASTGTLRPCPGDGVAEATTRNVVIEGDNLEVLKLLQKSYSGQVKLIYIDPPYNTGNDFVYPDDFTDGIGNYQRLTGQVDGDGRKLTSNPETSGRFHTDWLNMMYPRLKLARNLLTEDGVIFISCDDSEIHELKFILCDIFGEENVLGIIANINNPKGRSDDRFIASAHEYLVVAGKNTDVTAWAGFIPEENITRRYNKADEQDQKYREIDLRKTGDSDRRHDRPDMFYYFYYSQAAKVLRLSKLRDIATADELEIIPLRDDGTEGRWRWGFETATQQLSSLLSRYMPNRQIWGVFERDYLEGRSLVKPTSSWTFKEVNSERGSEQFMQLGFPKESFPRPKPVGTIQRILDIGAQAFDKSAIVLDFFAGSGTTGHAVMAQNAADGGSRRYVLVQLPEPLDPANKDQKTAATFCDTLGKPRTIAELTKERLRRAGVKVKAENPLFAGDTGFRVFKLDSSNLRTWEPDHADVAKSLEEATEHVKAGRTEADVLTELLLKLGLDLCVPVTTKTIAGKAVRSVGGGVLLACLAESIGRADAEPLALGIAAWHQELAPAGGSQVVFRDSAFADDVAKSNLAAILHQHGLSNVRSL